ncbi:hypothetical protein Hanom_Chr10g00938271 [Helianthus anomalus]
MLFFRPRVDQDIVDKYNHEFIKIWFAYAVHQIHKDRWCIRQPEWHHKKLVMSIACSKCSLWYAFFLDP